jgi:protein-disulfide isomerase
MGNKRLSVRDKRRQQLRRQRIITILIVVGVAVVFVGILIAPTLRNALAPVGDVSVPPTLNIPNPDRNMMGNPNAPVTIVEFSDFQCPYCKQFHDTLQQTLIQQYVEPGTVYFTYRTMGPWIGPESGAAAEAAYCAADQNRFWDYQNILFANQGAENGGSFANKRLVAFAEALGLNMNDFNACLDGNKYQNQVNQDRADGDAAGVQGTPSFVINGKLVGGALTAQGLQQEIDAALNASGISSPTPTP